MYKNVTIYENFETKLFYPANKTTSFMAEGYRGFYTIIDVTSIDDKMFALLEHNELGEESMLVAYLGRGVAKKILVMEKYDRSKIDTNLKEGAQKIIFIPQEHIITDEVFDSLTSVLYELDMAAACNTTKTWSDDDINAENEIIGGIIK